MPILYKPSFNHVRTPWMLVLAVAAVGGEYAGLETCKTYVGKLHEYLRKAISVLVDQHTAQTLQVWFAQVVLLSHIIMAYSGSKALILTQQSQKNLLITLARGLGAELKHQMSLGPTSRSTGNETDKINWWWRGEQSRRVIWSIWGLPTLMLLNDQLDLELQCPGDVWDTRLNKLNEQAGARLGLKVSLREAFQAMRDSGQAPDLDDFARRVVLLAVYQESRDLVQAAASLQRCGFLEYKSTGSSDDMASASGSSGIDAMYGRWRSRTLKALGVESAETCAVIGPTQLSWQYHHVVCIQLVTHGHVEAHHLLLAALMLWAYATFGPGGGDGGNGVVRLDRASDAEGQVWLQDARVVATVGGVGSIEGREGGRRVVAEARRIMTLGRAWPVRRRIMDVLDEVLQKGRVE
ncbi:hypothetical protein BKA80DRAFT_306482 [Phyllosticta citrichinensis]